MDRLDRKILRILQEDSTLAVADLAKKVGLSTTPCWRRIQKMEEDGVIRRRVALLDPVKVNTKVTVFVSIRTASHSIEWLKRFSEVVSEFPEVVEFYRMSGDVDYLLRVVVPDIAAYDAFYKRMIAKIEIRDVSSALRWSRSNIRRNCRSITCCWIIRNPARSDAPLIRFLSNALSGCRGGLFYLPVVATESRISSTVWVILMRY